ncbi:MAG: hypothetical protein RRY12_03945 [Cloacibacillus sp.]
MNYDDLVLEIINRVNDKVNKGEAASAAAASKKPRLLVAAQEDCALCQELRSAPALLERFEVESSLSKHYVDDIESCSTVVLFSMGVSDLAKIADACWDDAYTDTAVRAILLGKKVFIVKETVELFDYLSTAPRAYYEMLLGKLELLQRAGAAVLPYAQMLPALLGEEGFPKWQSCPTCQTSAAEAAPAEKIRKAEKELTLDKRVITEKDAAGARAAGASRLLIPLRAIVTDLAKEYAQSQGIVFVRV